MIVGMGMLFFWKGWYTEGLYIIIMQMVRMTHRTMLHTLMAVLAVVFMAVAPVFAQESLEGAQEITSTSTQETFETPLPEELFDIRLTIDVPHITPADQLAARAEFISFGRVPTPVALTWTVLDAYGAEVYRSKTETLVVETELVYPRRFVDMSKLTSGTYTLHLTTQYHEDVVDTFEQSFTVEEAKGDIVPFLIIGFMAVIGIGWGADFLMHHRGQVSHERIVTVTSRAAVFLIAGAVLPSAGLLITERLNVEAQRGAVYTSSLGLRTTTDTAAFITHAREVEDAYATLRKVVAYGDDAAVLEAVQAHDALSAFHIVDETNGVVLSMRKALGWSVTPGTLFAIPQQEGLVQANDTSWSSVARFPRAEGGYYVAQASFDTALAALTARSHEDEQVFLVNEEGRVVLEAARGAAGGAPAEVSSAMWEKMQTHEYYEGPCAGGRFFISRRLSVSTGTGYARYYVVTRGQQQLSATTHFAF